VVIWGRCTRSSKHEEFSLSYLLILVIHLYNQNLDLPSEVQIFPQPWNFGQQKPAVAWFGLPWTLPKRSGGVYRMAPWLFNCQGTSLSVSCHSINNIYDNSGDIHRIPWQPRVGEQVPSTVEQAQWSDGWDRGSSFFIGSRVLGPDSLHLDPRSKWRRRQEPSESKQWKSSGEPPPLHRADKFCKMQGQICIADF